MASKAKPKKLKAYVIASDTTKTRARIHRSSERNPLDIGEIHFLVKQEAKGDLRKDARVQDLNNVINRLISSAGHGGTHRGRHRLHLRTFTVTCLSEDCGILEWVPNTHPLRELVARSYNPQAATVSSKRRGRRIMYSLADPAMKKAFEEKCQNMFFERGDLKGAALMFEELCLKQYPPLLYWWFVQHFRDPHTWYEARTRFTLSSAAWSAVGHVIGLGDRHSENILVDATSGSVVHVDFDWYV